MESYASPTQPRMNYSVSELFHFKYLILFSIVAGLGPPPSEGGPHPRRGPGPGRGDQRPVRGPHPARGPDPGGGGPCPGGGAQPPVAGEPQEQRESHVVVDHAGGNKQYPPRQIHISDKFFFFNVLFSK